MNNRMMVAGLAVLSAGLARGVTQPVVDTDVVFRAGYVEDFVLDGNVDKAVWKDAEILPGQLLQGGAEAMPCKDEVKVLYSTNALYVGATLFQDLSKASFRWDQRDMPIWDEDNLELFLFLQMENGKNGLYQFLFNPLGTVTDLLDGNIVYSNYGIETKTVRHTDRWTLEVRIPFAGIPMDRPVAGDFVGARFCRWVHDGAKRYHSSSPCLIEPGNDQRGRFAKLVFEKPTGPDADRMAEADRGYREELQRKRFYRKYDALMRRIDEVRGGSEYFRRSSHPMFRKVLSEVAKIAECVTAFEERWKDELASRRPVDADAAERFFAAAEAFDRYAAQNAYAAWIADPWSSGSESDLPPEDAPMMPAKLAFEQAGNEREQVCLELVGLLCGSRLDLRFWPEAVGTKCNVYSPKGPYLSSDSFEVYVEPFVQIEGEVVTMPLSRVQGDFITITPGRTVRVWIVFNSRGVDAGTYRTALKFKPLNDQLVSQREVPLEAKVWNFSLPETHDWPLKSFFWGAALFNNDEADQLQMAWENHITHGWTQFHRYRYGLCRESNVWRGPKKGMEKAPPDHDFDDDVALHGNQAFLEKARELKMRFVFGWGTPKSLDWFKTMTRRLLDMGFEYEDFVFKGLLGDEFMKADIPCDACYRDAVWGWSTNLHFQATLTSTPPPTGASIQDLVDAKLPQFYTQWAIFHGLLDDPVRGPETVKVIKAAGKEAWGYNCARFMHKQGIRSYYRFYPWQCWLMGLDGVAVWTFFGAKNDGWDSRDGLDDGITWRGAKRTCVPTKQLAAFREGLEDVAYMDMLEKFLKDGKAKGGMRDECVRLLGEREAIIKSDNQARVDAWRLAVGRAIDALAK